MTGLVLTFNEAPNIARTLAQLAWLSEIVVVDSHSTDGTPALAAAFPNVRVVQRPFTTHAEQWNFGLEAAGIDSEWVLALDADFVLSDDGCREIQALQPADDVAGYWASFDYCIEGRPLRGAAYPPVVVLYRRTRGRYAQDGHTQREQQTGPLLSLAHRIQHDDRKSLTHWLGAQARYMALEAEKLTSGVEVGVVDRVRQWIVIAPPAMFVYCYLIRGGILDGKAGLYYALQRATSEAILSLFLVWRRLPGGR
ncbi:MAG: glycosyltransferase family 2 protein [Acidobacteriota bacterium]|nr:glycosyltransferase family 2 protein [Acidobacteriota bacterium]